MHDSSFWPIFFAAVLVNAIIAAVVYTIVSEQQGKPTAITLAKIGRKLMTRKGWPILLLSFSYSLYIIAVPLLANEGTSSLMEFLNSYWLPFVAILLASFAVAIVAYPVVLQRQGQKTGAIIKKTGVMAGTVLERTFIICIGLPLIAVVALSCIELLAAVLGYPLRILVP